MSSGVFGGNASLEQKKEAGDAVHRVNKGAGAHAGSRGRGQGGRLAWKWNPSDSGKRRSEREEDSGQRKPREESFGGELKEEEGGIVFRSSGKRTFDKMRTKRGCGFHI